MALNIPLATAAANATVAGLPDKRCHNVYLEPDPTDPKNETVLVETPGSLQRNDFSGACRGMWQADGHAGGKILVAHGTTMATYDIGTDTAGTLTGSTAGTDNGDFAFTEDEGFGLFDGDLYVSDGTAIAAVTDADFATLLSDAGATAFTSVATMGQRGLFTYGPRFGFTAVLDLDNTTALNYYTAESSPDDLVAGRVLGELYYLFGTQTIEVWAQTGDDADPFALQPGMTQQVGCLSRSGIIKTDNAIMFVDVDRNVRRLGVGGSEIISQPWVTRLLKQADVDEILGFTYVDEGHIFAGWRTPYGTAVFDVMNAQWHTRGTLNTDTWRYTHVVKAQSRIFACDATGQFDELSRDYASESMPNTTTTGDVIQRMFSAFLPAGHFETIPAVQLIVSQGVGTLASDALDPLIGMRISVDGGQTFTAKRNRKLGEQGVYDEATIWRMNGSALRRGVVFLFEKTDPVKAAYKALQRVDA